MKIFKKSVEIFRFLFFLKSFISNINGMSVIKEKTKEKFKSQIELQELKSAITLHLHNLC